MLVHAGQVALLKTNEMSFDANRKAVMETWNQLVASLSSAFFTYYEARKVEIIILLILLRLSLNGVPLFINYNSFFTVNTKEFTIHNCVHNL